MHRAASVIVPDGSRFCRWQEPLHPNGMSHCTAGAQVPGGKRRRSARRKETLRRAAEAPRAGDAAAGGRNCCAGRQETLRQQQSPCASDRSRCTGPQKTLLLAAGAAAPGVRSRRAGRQDTRLETLLRAAGDVAASGGCRCVGSSSQAGADAGGRTRYKWVEADVAGPDVVREASTSRITSWGNMGWMT